MKKIIIFFLLSSIGIIANAGVEYPSGSGIWYDWNGDGDFGCTWMNSSTTLEEVVIPATITIDGYSYTPTFISGGNLWGNTTVKKLVIEAPIESIPGWFCENCTNLETVEFADGIEGIGQAAFKGCGSLTSIQLPSSVTAISSDAFSNTGITDVYMSGSPITVSSTDDCRLDWAFYGLTGVTLHFTGDVTTDAFRWGLSPFSKIIFENGCTSICADAFKNENEWSMTSEPEITFADNSDISSIGESAFWGDLISDIKLPASLQTIGSYVWGGNTALTSITFSGVPTSIGDGIFPWDDTDGYSKFFVCCSYWNLKALQTVLNTGNTGVQYKVWDAELDETWDNGQNLGTAYADELTVRRTLHGNYWNTIILPVYLTSEQISSVFGSDARIAEFVGCNSNVMDFSSVSDMEANKPYLLWLSSDMSSFTIPYVWLSDNFDQSTTTVGDYSFIGTLNGYENYVPAGALFIEANLVYQSTGLSVLGGMRGYFTVPSTAEVSRINTYSVDGTPSGIELLSHPSGLDANIYSINGVRLSNPSRGIQIINNKKLLIR